MVKEIETKTVWVQFIWLFIWLRKKFSKSFSVLHKVQQTVWKWSERRNVEVAKRLEKTVKNHKMVRFTGFKLNSRRRTGDKAHTADTGYPNTGCPTLATPDLLPLENSTWTDYSPGLLCCDRLIIECNKQFKAFGIWLSIVIYFFHTKCFESTK